MKYTVKISVVLFVSCLAVIEHTDGKVFTRCGLTQELIRKNFNRSFLGHWVCLIESESGKDTSKVSDRANGKYLGLFQIKSKEWCTYGKPGGKCNMKCERVCLIESESGKDTSKVSDRANGKYLGLFQIKSKEWCTYGKPGGKCNMKCEMLLDDDITDDSACVKKVYDANGFKGWSGWQRNCYGRVVPIPQC